MEGIAYNVVSMHNLEGVEGDHEGRPHVVEGIGRNAVGAGLVPAPNATTRWGVERIESIGRNAVGAGLVPAPNATPWNVVTALSMERQRFRRRCRQLTFIYLPR